MSTTHGLSDEEWKSIIENPRTHRQLITAWAAYMGEPRDGLDPLQTAVLRRFVFLGFKLVLNVLDARFGVRRDNNSWNTFGG
jgi:hypothetical protein